MDMGYTYTLFSGNLLAPPIMTGHHLNPDAARGVVEKLMARDETIFRGVVRPVGMDDAEICARSLRPGKFVWLPSAPTVPASWRAVCAS